ncbi:MAG: hypothetical protein GY751_01285 [Bacteroidetes bacterium]|nr:hypothetical protein [Bacteroidota bacterium]
MKYKYLTVCLILSLLITSCVSIYFNQPQPVETKNLKKAPKSIRGVWLDELDTTVIDKKTYYHVEWYLDTISKTTVDTTTSLEIRNNMIYDIEDDPLTGYAFTDYGDRIIIKVPDRMEFTLSDSSILRMVSRSYYSFNARKDMIWWEVFLVQKMEDGSINIRYPSSNELSILESMDAGEEKETQNSEDTFLSSEFQKFWEADLTRQLMIEFIELGGFSDTVLVLDKGMKQ